MPTLTSGLIAELACSVTSWFEMERTVLELLEREVGADTVFFMDQLGPTTTCRGVLSDTYQRLRQDWAAIASTQSPRLLLNAALASNGVVIDSELFGSALRQQKYYDVFMAPVRGYTTLFGVMSSGATLARRGVDKCTAVPSDVRGEVVLGRCLGSKPFTATDRAKLAGLLPTLTLAHRAFHPDTSRPLPMTLAPLTAREREVVSYLHLGYTNREIGVALGTKERTVRNQLSQIYEKLGVSGRAEAVGLLNPGLATTAARSV